MPASGSLPEPHRQANVPGLSHTWNRIWDRGYLVSWGSIGSHEASPTEPSVVLYDRDGHIAREGIVWFKDAYSVSITDAAVNRAGNLVVSGGTENQAGAIANFIASIGTDGRLSQVIRTTPFLPIYVCAAEDGTVWSYGIDRDEEGRGIAESLRLRQYSFDKGQLMAMLDVSTLNASGWTLTQGRYPGEISLRCNSQRIGLYNGRSGEWVEFDFAADKLKVAKVEPLPSPKTMRITGFALTDAGDVFVSLHDRSGSPPRSGLFRLQFDSTGLGSWIPVKNTVGPYLHGGPIERLLGADGPDLIYTRDLDGMAYWSKYTK
ncbi:MAG: hypothetical protein WCA49_22435 [Candidatus Sulfotelmatobacter sp.]